ncbi:MAG: cysteine-rich CWC family protein [Gemmatimonadota bacterium]
MTESFIDPSRCPLCQGTNDCGMAADRGVCWCFSTKVPAAVREMLPDAALDLACVCHSCLAAIQQSA